MISVRYTASESVYTAVNKSWRSFAEFAVTATGCTAGDHCSITYQAAKSHSRSIRLSPIVEGDVIIHITTPRAQVYIMIIMNKLRQLRDPNVNSRHSHSPSPPLRRADESNSSDGLTRSARLRILCLHGYHGSARVMHAQLGSLKGMLEPYADLIAVDAPSLDQGDFGWWHATSSPFTHETTYQGWERTKTGLGRIFLEQGPFDGILGFSQGAILAGILCGMNGVSDLPIKFDFAIMVGGFLARDKELAKVYAHRELYAIPTLHVYGTSDMVVDALQSEKLSLRFRDPQVIVHS